MYNLSKTQLRDLFVIIKRNNDVKLDDFFQFAEILAETKKEVREPKYTLGETLLVSDVTVIKNYEAE